MDHLKNIQIKIILLNKSTSDKKIKIENPPSHYDSNLRIMKHFYLPRWKNLNFDEWWFQPRHVESYLDLTIPNPMLCYSNLDSKHFWHNLDSFPWQNGHASRIPGFGTKFVASRIRYKRMRSRLQIKKKDILEFSLITFIE